MKRDVKKEERHRVSSLCYCVRAAPLVWSEGKTLLEGEEGLAGRNVVAFAVVFGTAQEYSPVLDTLSRVRCVWLMFLSLFIHIPLRFEKCPRPQGSSLYLCTP